MDFSGKRIHIAGSAGKAVPRGRLRTAHEFVTTLVRRVLDGGGELVVFASGEPRLVAGDPSLSQVFDWTVLDEVRRAANAGGPARRMAVVVTSTRSLADRIREDRRATLEELLERGTVEPMIIPDDNHVGGYIRSTIAGVADALVAVGGGKGIVDLHRAFVALGRPVLPMGLDIGSSCNDGTGAVGLHRRAIESPLEFFPNVPDRLRTTLMTRGLAGDTGDPNASAEAAASLLGEELVFARPVSIVRPVDVVILGVIPVELGALLKVFPFGANEARTKNGTLYWTGQLERGNGTSYSVAIAAAGSAGNSLTAAVVTDLCRELSPRLVLLAGIAGGQEGKYRLGEVVIADTVVPYESAALVDAPVTRQISRAGGFSLAFRLQQDVTAYIARDPMPRLAKAYQDCGIVLPQPGAGAIERPSVKTATIGSGEKLVRDGSYLARLQAEVHGKIDVVEMEAGGLAHACHVAGKPFIVVRGISDLANSAKGDRQHDLAAKGAALVARDLLAHGVDLAGV